MPLRVFQVIHSAGELRLSAATAVSTSPASISGTAKATLPLIELLIAHQTPACTPFPSTLAISMFALSLSWQNDRV
jgi:hypothetical protein